MSDYGVGNPCLSCKEALNNSSGGRSPALCDQCLQTRGPSNVDQPSSANQGAGVRESATSNELSFHLSQMPLEGASRPAYDSSTDSDDQGASSLMDHDHGGIGKPNPLLHEQVQLVRASKDPKQEDGYSSDRKQKVDRGTSISGVGQEIVEQKNQKKSIKAKYTANRRGIRRNSSTASRLSVDSMRSLPRKKGRIRRLLGFGCFKRYPRKPKSSKRKESKANEGFVTDTGNTNAVQSIAQPSSFQVLQQESANNQIAAADDHDEADLEHGTVYENGNVPLNGYDELSASDALFATAAHNDMASVAENPAPVEQGGMVGAVGGEIQVGDSPPVHGATGGEMAASHQRQDSVLPKGKSPVVHMTADSGYASWWRASAHGDRSTTDALKAALLRTQQAMTPPEVQVQRAEVTQRQEQIAQQYGGAIPKTTGNVTQTARKPPVPVPRSRGRPTPAPRLSIRGNQQVSYEQYNSQTSIRTDTESLRLADKNGESLEVNPESLHVNRILNDAAAPAATTPEVPASVTSTDTPLGGVSARDSSTGSSGSTYIGNTQVVELTVTDFSTNSSGRGTTASSRSSHLSSQTSQSSRDARNQREQEMWNVINNLQQQLTVSNTNTDILRQQLIDSNANTDILRQQLIDSNANTDNLRQQLADSNERILRTNELLCELLQRRETNPSSRCRNCK